MWPFKSKSTAEYKVPELKDIKFGEYLYTPKKDITPYEVALLLPLFGSIGYYVDRRAYIEKNNLTRHFTKESQSS